MRILLLLVTCVIGVSLDASAQWECAPLANAYDRPHTALDGAWPHFPDRYEAYFYDFVRIPFDSSGQGKRDFAAMDAVAQTKTDRYEYAFDGQPTLRVPSDWNSQYERYLLYEGSMWYRQRFQVEALDTLTQRLILRFGAANYRADVYVNGMKAGVHEGGFTPFHFDITRLVRTDTTNALVVRVDNQRRKDAVPTDVTDWWNYGGLTRSVALYTVPRAFISETSIHVNGHDLSNAELEAQVQLAGDYAAGQLVSIECSELGLRATAVADASGKTSFRESGLNIKRPWSPADPYRYAFTIATSTDTVTEHIGLRTIATRGHEILLNGKATFLRGICAHEENPLEGRRATSYQDALQLITWARELGANFMRLAHYPHNEHMPRIADSLGMWLWEEIPVYWTIDWENPSTYASAEQQLTELIVRDRNRASVIIWSLANETPNTPARLTFLRRLADRARELDSSRLISAALFKENIGPQRYEVADPFAEYADVVSFNEYIGWYEGTPAVLDGARFSFRQNKPVIVSEFGAGAKAGLRGDSLTRWSEDYQDWMYRETLELIDRTPEVAGFTPWILADFRSPRRNNPGIQDGWNRKGLIGQNGQRKLAFHTLQRYYAQKAKE